METSALRRRLEGKEEELIRLQTTIDSQTASIEDLNVCPLREIASPLIQSPAAHLGGLD